MSKCETFYLEIEKVGFKIDSEKKMSLLVEKS